MVLNLASETLDADYNSFSHFDQPYSKSDTNLLSNVPTIGNIELEIGSSPCHDSSFTRVETCLESYPLNIQSIPYSNYKSIVHDENSTSKKDISLDSINKSNSNVLILNQIMSYHKYEFSISIQIDSYILYDCVSNNLLNKSIYSPPIETLGNNF